MLSIRTVIGILALLAASISWAQTPEYKVGVDGMSCPFCVYGLEKQIKKMDGVNQIETNLEQGEIIISMKEGASLQREGIDKAVTNAGFSVRSFERSGETKAP